MKVYRFKCKDCGATKYEKVDEHTYKCSYCGYREEVHREETVEEVEKPKTEPIINFNEVKTTFKTNSRTTHYLIVLIACIFFGTFGIHRFLEKKFLSGVVYLCTFGLFGIGVFFDIIAIGFKIVRSHNEEDHDSGRTGDYYNE